MKKLFTLLTAAMLVFAVSATAQSRKTWDFTKGVSESTRALLDADNAKWSKELNDDGTTARWITKFLADGELTAGDVVIPEFSGLKFSGFGADNAMMYFGTKIRLQKKATVTISDLTAGQKITMTVQSANGDATDRGFTFVNALTAESNSEVTVPGPNGVDALLLTVLDDGPVSISTGLDGGPASGVEIHSIIIDEGDKNIKTWNFANWSEATATSVLAAEDWTKKESDSKEYITGDEIRWISTPAFDANEDLTAGGVTIAEMKGLRHTGLATYGYAIAFNYQTTLDNNAWGPYNGPAYLWVMGSASSIIVPNVKAGSTFKIGVESHKPGDACGFNVIVGGTTVATLTTDAYAVLETTIPEGEDEFVDVTLTATRGVHLYSIEAEVKDEAYVDMNPKLGSPKYSIADGDKINPVTVTGLSITFPKQANLAEGTKLKVAFHFGPVNPEEGDEFIDAAEVEIDAAGVTYSFLDFFTEPLKENTAYEFYFTSIEVVGYEQLNVAAAEGEKLYPLTFETSGAGIATPRSWAFTNTQEEVDAIQKTIDDGLNWWVAASKGRYAVLTGMFVNGNKQLLMAENTPLPITEGLYFEVSGDSKILVGSPAQNNGKLQIAEGNLVVPMVSAGDEVSVTALYATTNKGTITIENGVYEDTTGIQLSGSATVYKIKVTSNGDLVLKSKEAVYRAIEVFPSAIEKKDVDYTVNAVTPEGTVLKVLAEGTATTNDAIDVPYSYWLVDSEGKAYTKGSRGTPFTESITIAEESVYNIEYKATDIDSVVYVTEAEDIEGVIVSSHANSAARSSNTKAAYNEADITLTTLQPGSYRIAAIIFDSNNSFGFAPEFAIGDTVIVMDCDAVNFSEVKSGLFVVETPTDVIWKAGGSNAQCLDAVMIYQTKEEDVDTGINEISVDNTVNARPVKVLVGNKLVIKTANATYSISGTRIR